MAAFTSPEPLNQSHDTGGFASGQPSLDQWLRTRALRNEKMNVSRTFVSTETDSLRVAGFYSLAASAIRLAIAPGPVRRNSPDPIPVILLGRLAIDQSYQGIGLGRALLKDAVRRVLTVADVVGVRALLVNAIDDEAAAFYQHFEFITSPIDERTLFLPLSRIQASGRQ